MTRAELAAVAKGIAPVLREYFAAVTDRLSAVDLKEKGLDGGPGPRGLQGEPGRDGRDGLPGVPGVDGKDGVQGQDGKDAMGFNDIQVEHDGERGFTFKFVRGEQVKTFGSFIVPAMIHRGVFDASKTYERGDVVTWGGSQWHANAKTSAKPGEASAASRAWVLIVKKGSDGKDGKPGDRGHDGKDGKDGKWGV